METSYQRPIETLAPGARIAGRDAPAEAALAAAVRGLRRARLPLVCGLTAVPVEAQRAAVALAEALGGVVDPGLAPGQEAALLAGQRIGRLGAGLGELRAHATLLVYWGVDPDARHPGFHARFLAPVPGHPPPARIAVELGAARPPSGIAERITIAPEREVEALLTLRALAGGRRVEETRVAALGAPLARLRDLARRLAGARHVVILFDTDPHPLPADPHRDEAIHALAMELAPGTRCRALGVRVPDNSAGAERVLTWQTGYPFAVSFHRAHPRFGPTEFRAESLLARGEADAVLLVDASAAARLSRTARERLERVATVVLRPVGAAPPLASPAVEIPVAAPEHTPGSVYRMDGVALRRRVPPPRAPTAAQVLERLHAALDAARAGGPR